MIHCIVSHKQPQTRIEQGASGPVSANPRRIRPPAPSWGQKSVGLIFGIFFSTTQNSPSFEDR